MDILERLAQKIEVDPDTNCWLWTGVIHHNGYGFISYECKQVSVHRLMYSLVYGDIPDGLCVLHRCDVRNCINPEHLFLGTYQDNWDDCCRKGRQATGLKNGTYTRPEKRPKGELHGRHKLTEEDVICIRNKYATGAYFYKTLAHEYEMDPSTIRAIVLRKNWKHVV